MKQKISFKDSSSIDRLCTIYIFWIINNHSFIQINFICVLGLIKDEKKINLL